MKYNKNSKYYQYCVKYFNKNRIRRSRTIILHDYHPDKVLQNLLNKYKMNIAYSTPQVSKKIKSKDNVPAYMCIDTVINNIPYTIVIDRNSCIEVLINTTYNDMCNVPNRIKNVHRVYTNNYHPKGNVYDEEPEIRFSHPDSSTNDILNSTIRQDNINNITEEELFQLDLLVPTELYIIAHKFVQYLMDRKVNHSKNSILYAISTIHEFNYSITGS